jgi:hypothetical protein
MIDPRCHDVCPACGKVRYTSREQALIAAARQGRRGKARAYSCGRSWHLTRWAPEVYSREQRP